MFRRMVDVDDADCEREPVGADVQDASRRVGDEKRWRRLAGEARLEVVPEFLSEIVVR